MPRAVALFSGGLDSMLAVRLMQRQGFEVEALNVRTTFSCCQAAAAQSATALGARLTVTHVADDYLGLIRNPLYGYGKGANPCIDCRIHMCQMAARLMQQVGAEVVVTGEVLGQRPMSQKRQHLEIIARRSGLADCLVRPLSARLLPETEVERRGVVDRGQLLGLSGRSRKPLLKLAAELDLPNLPGPSTGCTLTEPNFSPRVFDLLQHTERDRRWEFDLLMHGRHFRFDGLRKVVVGRNEADNIALRTLADRDDAPQCALLVPKNFSGPEALVVGPADEPSLRFAAGLVLRFAGQPPAEPPQVWASQQSNRLALPAVIDEAVRSARPL